MIFKITGMTCAACSAAVERAVSRMQGVSSAAVNLAMATLTIEGEASAESVVAVVERIGYGASPIASATEAAADGTEEDGQARLWKQFKWMIVFTLPLFIISMAPMLVPLPDAINPERFHEIYYVAQFLLTLPVIILGRGFFARGARHLMAKSPNMDTLIATGSGAAFLYSLFQTVNGFIHGGHAHLYYESAAVILTLITLGKYLEARAKSRSSSAIRALLDLSPKTVTLIENGNHQTVNAADLRPGDIILVRPGEAVGADGVVVSGSSAVDEALLTGESLPVDKQPGDRCIGGSILKEGSIEMRVERVGADTVLQSIVRLVSEAMGSKAPAARLADKISGIFVPIVFALAVLAAVGWLIAGEDISFVLSILISVLVTACPCALGLATPISIMAATGRGAQCGILIKSAAALERAHSADILALDKTGTITRGEPNVIAVCPAEGVSETGLLSAAAAVDRMSEHPLARAIVKYAEQAGTCEIAEVTGFRALLGQGAMAQSADGRTILVGNRPLMDENTVEIDSAAGQAATRLAGEAATIIYVAADGRLLGVIGLADTIKPESAKAIARLKGFGMRVVLLTGDNQITAEAIAREAGISEIRAGLLPAGKAEAIAELCGEGTVIMVGDGVNDAPALTRADVGMAIAAGADVAIESADIVLMGSSLSDVVTAVKLSRSTMRSIAQNLFWAFAYNVLLIPIAMGFLHLFGGPLMSPMLAALAMSLSSVTVVFNALRLKIKRI